LTAIAGPPFADGRAGVGFSGAHAERPWAKAGAVPGNVELALILEL
jgi:hypothetical protein